MFSILIPSFNNLKYLKLCLHSIKINSKFNHQIIIHVNEGNDGTLDYLKQTNIDFSYSKHNSGICEGINRASKLAKYDYFLYAHDDFYFCPHWDQILFEEIGKIGHNNFYLSGTMMNNGHISFDCGDQIENFNEKKFLSEYKNFNHYDFNGSTWAPALIHKDIWNKVGGFSEEYFPGTGSDPDFNMKLWKKGVRIFKGLNDFKVYHFGSLTTRKNTNLVKNRGNKIFLKKWGITINFFKKYYLKSKTEYHGPLREPNITPGYIFGLLFCKLQYIFHNFFHF